MRFTIELEEDQVRAVKMIADRHGLTTEETVELFVLTGVQEVVMGITRPGMTPVEVNKALEGHADRLIAELKRRRSGGNGSKLIRPWPAGR